MSGTSVIAVLDQAGVPRRGADDRPLLQAERVRILVAERDRARATSGLGASPVSIPFAAERAAQERALVELADVSEWGHADTGVRA